MNEQEGNVFASFKVYTDKWRFIQIMDDQTAGRLFKQLFACYMGGEPIVPGEDVNAYDRAIYQDFEDKVMEQREKDITTSRERSKAGRSKGKKDQAPP